MLLAVLVAVLLVACLAAGWIGGRFLNAWRSLRRDLLVRLQQPAARSASETALNLSILLAPFALLALVAFYASGSGAVPFAATADLIAHSLGARHMTGAVGGSARKPKGTGSAVRNAKPALQDLSRWAGRRGHAARGRAGGGITTAIAPVPLPLAAPRQVIAPTEGCSSAAACAAEENVAAAWVECRPYIERAAPPHRWTPSPVDVRFNAFSSESPDSHVITFIGGGLQVRGADGIWRNRRFSCEFDTATGEVVGARIVPLVHALGG